MDTNQEIIAFKNFDSAIEANIIKTKLDAYGIPCFLTEENLSNLYPGQNFMMFRVRLHLFAKDEEQAENILSESNLTVDDDDTTHCPQCKSNKVERDFPKRFEQKLISSLSVALFGIFFPQNKINHCLDCDHEF